MELPPESNNKPQDVPQDILESAPPSSPLSEENFKGPEHTMQVFPAWLWIFLITAITAILWGMGNWGEKTIQDEKRNNPFLEVTNREFSLFLWHFPSFLRGNAREIPNYLDAFARDRPLISSSKADLFVSAPPELLFLYHTWHRLLAHDPVLSPIPPEQFTQFLNEVPEWNKDNWLAAPKAYQEWISSKAYLNLSDLRQAPENELPLQVRQAFQGWRNYTLQGELINQVAPTVKEVESFLSLYPNYSRNYWRNINRIQDQDIAGLNYLKSLLDPSSLSQEMPFPPEELATFLKIALFNAQQNPS